MFRKTKHCRAGMGKLYESVATDNHGRIHGDPCPWSVVRGLHSTVPMPVRGPWSVDCLLAIAKAVRGLLSVDHGQLLSMTVRNVAQSMSPS